MLPQPVDLVAVWAPAHRVLFLTVFIDLMGFGIVVPVLAFCAKGYGASGMTLGLILGVSSSLSALARVIGPPLAGLAYDALKVPGAMLSEAVIVTIAITFSLRLLRGRAAMIAGEGV